MYIFTISYICVALIIFGIFESLDIPVDRDNDELCIRIFIASVFFPIVLLIIFGHWIGYKIKKGL